jgi:hypothetical protein
LHKGSHAAVIDEHTPLQFFEKLRQCRSPDGSGRVSSTGKAASIQEYRSLLPQPNDSGSTVTSAAQKVSDWRWTGRGDYGHRVHYTGLGQHS